MAVTCIKGTMIACNAILCIISLCVGITGVVIYAQPSLVKGDAGFGGLMLVVGVFGFIVMVLSFFGLVGAWTENMCMLITYIVLVVIVSLLTTAAMGSSFYYFVSEEGKKELHEFMVKALTDQYKKYNEDADTRKVIDSLQKEVECCGCLVPGDSGPACTRTELIVPGCCGEVPRLFFKHGDALLIGVPVGLTLGLVIEILAIVFACLMVSGIRRRGNAGTFTANPRVPQPRTVI